MKKIFAMAVALIAAVSVQAQDLTDNYQKIYAGFTTYNLDESGFKDYTTNGFQVGYAYAFNISGHNIPLFLEVGAEFNYGSKEKDGTTLTASNIALPINVTYKFGNENFAVAPFIGEALRVWTAISTEAGGNKINWFDEDKGDFTRVQAVFNAGVNFTIKEHVLIGYRFQVSTTSVEPDVKIGTREFKGKSDMAHSISVGYVF